MPSSPMGKNNKYYQVDVSCGSSKTSGLWDYNAWRLNLDYIESNSKCNLTFTSSMSKEEYDKYIQAGVALRRNTYRGKDITDLWKSGELYTQISNGTFADIYVGDYIVSEKQDSSKKNIVWLIADLDNYWHQGDSGDTLTKHHATIIPAYKLQDNRMNATNTTKGGYKGSEMYTTTLPSILKNIIDPDFTKDGKSHVLTYRNMVTTEVDETFSNMHGQTTGASSNWTYDNRQLDLMSEMNVYGAPIWSSSGFDIGLDNRQYAIFQLKPELISQDLAGNKYWYWLKAVTMSTGFANVHGEGYSSSYQNGANVAGGVRPRFLIG